MRFWKVIRNDGEPPDPSEAIRSLEVVGRLLDGIRRQAIKSGDLDNLEELDEALQLMDRLREIMRRVRAELRVRVRRHK